jgi:hypothetical protein
MFTHPQLPRGQRAYFRLVHGRGKHGAGNAAEVPVRLVFLDAGLSAGPHNQPDGGANQSEQVDKAGKRGVEPVPVLEPVLQPDAHHQRGVGPIRHLHQGKKPFLTTQL